MTVPAHIQRLAARGFRLLPLLVNSKLPGIEGYPERATDEPKMLAAWFYDDVFNEPYGYNVGISTTHFGDGGLVVIDVDDKNDKHGSVELAKLEMQGFELPPTYTQKTPSGGRHLVFKAAQAVKQGVDVLGSGLDIRSHGGFIVGSGSTIDGVPYTDNGLPVVDAPQWLIDRCGKPIERTALSSEPPENIDQERATERVIDYLRNRAPESIKGSGGDATAYSVACAVKDFGVSQSDALDLMMEHWFDGSGWSYDRLSEKVEHAYRYGKHSVGSRSAAGEFNAIESKADAAFDTKPRTLPIRALKDIQLGTMPPAILPGVFLAQTMIVIAGQSGTGKTAVALAFEHIIATGGLWKGRTVRPYACLHLFLEGGSATDGRLIALRTKYGLDDEKVPLYSVVTAIDLMSPADVELVKQTIRGIESVCCVTVGMVVIDTLARAMGSGADENSAADMGHLVRNVDQIRAIGPAVVLIHHTGKDDSRGARGSSALRAAVDTELIVGDGMVRTTKQRDLEAGRPIPFVLEQVGIGNDADGRPATSVVAVFTSSAVSEFKTPSPLKPGSAAMSAADLLARLVADSDERVNGRPAAAITKWRDEWFKTNVRTGTKTDTADKAFRRARTSLLSEGHTFETHDFAYFSPRSDIPDKALVHAGHASDKTDTTL